MGLLRNIYIKVLPAPLKNLARTAYLKVGSTIYRFRHPGTQCQCNFCGFAAGKFMAGGYREGVLHEKQVIGGGFRANARCPKCFSLDRERQILYVLRKEIPLDESSRVLHVAPERNLNEMIRKEMTNQVDECDLVPESYAWAPNISKQDLTNLTFENDSFDLVVCNHVMEHIPEDGKAQAELLRVLKPGGYAILQIPYSESIPDTEEDPLITSVADRLLHYGQDSHVRLYERNDYIRRVESQGFESQFMQPNRFRHVDYFGLDPREGIFLFQKPGPS